MLNIITYNAPVRIQSYRAEVAQLFRTCVMKYQGLSHDMVNDHNVLFIMVYLNASNIRPKIESVKSDFFFFLRKEKFRTQSTHSPKTGNGFQNKLEIDSKHPRLIDDFKPRLF